MKVENPFFSIIIPAYNTSNFIRDALDSVLYQTFDEYEIIIVNDGSKDDTLDVIEAYFPDLKKSDYRIINQNNRGIAAARNIGIENSKGDFVAFLDADDTWQAEKLAEVKEVIVNIPNVDLITHDEYVESYGKLSSVHKCKGFDKYEDLLFKGNSMSTSATVVRRNKLIEAGLFSENKHFNGVEDYDLWLRLSKICKFYFIHKMLGTYRDHPAGISKNLSKQLQHSFNILEHHFSQWPDTSLKYRLLMRKRRSQMYMGSGLKFNNMGEYSEARGCLWKALSEYIFNWKAWILLLFNILHLSIKK